MLYGDREGKYTASSGRLFSPEQQARSTLVLAVQQPHCLCEPPSAERPARHGGNCQSSTLSRFSELVVERVFEQVIVMPKISFESVVPVRSAPRESLVAEELVEAPKWGTWGQVGLRRSDHQRWRRCRG